MFLLMLLGSNREQPLPKQVMQLVFEWFVNCHIKNVV